MPMVNGYSHEMVVIISEALNFTEEVIKKYYEQKKQTVNISHQNLIEAESEKEIQLLDNARAILKRLDDYNITTIDDQNFLAFKTVVKSALEIYHNDLSDAKMKTGLTTFDSKISEVQEIIDLESFREISDKKYMKYQALPEAESTKEIQEVFFSYATADKVLAGKIAEELRQKINVFLAHDDLDISDEWRKEILEHLTKDHVLISLLTPNYEKSVWCNQEAGFIIGKKGRIIPIIVEGVDITKFAFIESYQGVHLCDGNVKKCVDKVLESLP
ncbi:MAG: toll/interleukin-1 receptor domain-containing protein [Candidatus Bathyarchaeota archaeon]|nr:toll/interleukin-1 receptor domain-containing protein [Candidatus Bathyarchaeota archaeon]